MRKERLPQLSEEYIGHQVWCVPSHCCRHSTWYTCPHFVLVTCTPSSNLHVTYSLRQITQDGPAKALSCWEYSTCSSFTSEIDGGVSCISVDPWLVLDLEAAHTHHTTMLHATNISLHLSYTDVRDSTIISIV